MHKPRGCLNARAKSLTRRVEGIDAMHALTVTAKGQITLNQELLRHMGVQAGEKIEVTELPGGEVRLRATRPSGKVQDFVGSLKREGQKPISIEEMNEAIEKGWAGQL